MPILMEETVALIRSMAFNNNINRAFSHAQFPQFHLPSSAHMRKSQPQKTKLKRRRSAPISLHSLLFIILYKIILCQNSLGRLSADKWPARRFILSRLFKLSNCVIIFFFFRFKLVFGKCTSGRSSILIELFASILQRMCLNCMPIETTVFKCEFICHYLIAQRYGHSKCWKSLT